MPNGLLNDLVNKYKDIISPPQHYLSALGSNIGQGIQTLGQNIQAVRSNPQFAQELPSLVNQGTQKLFAESPLGKSAVGKPLGMTVGGIEQGFTGLLTSPFTHKPVPEQAGDILKGVGATAYSPTGIGFGAFNTALKAGSNLLQQKPINTDLSKAYEEGLQQGFLFAPISAAANYALKPLLNKISPVEVKNINQYLDLAKNATSEEIKNKMLGLAAKRVVQNISSSAISGGVAFGAVGAVKPAKNMEERVHNILSNGLEGAAFNAVAKGAQFGGQALVGQVLKPSKTYLESPEGQAGKIKPDAKVGLSSDLLQEPDVKGLAKVAKNSGSYDEFVSKVQDTLPLHPETLGKLQDAKLSLKDFYEQANGQSIGVLQTADQNANGMNFLSDFEDAVNNKDYQKAQSIVEQINSAPEGSKMANYKPLNDLLQSRIQNEIGISPAAKERGFITTIKESPNTAEAVAKGVEGTYTPITNIATNQDAKAYLALNGEANAKAAVLKEPFSAQTNLIGQEIARTAQQEGRDQDAIDIIQELAKKGTQAGQANQAFSVWSKLTPEGMLRYANSEIDNANKNAPFLTKAFNKLAGKQAAELTPEDSKIITDLMEKANATDNDEEKAVYMRQVFEHIGKKIPWGVSEVLDEYRYNNMLSNPLTNLRNAINNLGQTYFTRPATLAAEGKPLEAAKYELGALKGIPDGIDSFISTIKSGDSFKKMDLENPDTLKPIVPRRLGKLYNIPSTTMEAMDQMFSSIIKSGEEARGASPEEAKSLAEYTLFRQDLNPEGQGYLLDGIDNVTRAVYGLRKVGLGWFIPFIKTPMNVAKQWIEYSPAGVATALGSDNTREQLAKAGLGSIATLIGANLALQGKTTWAAPTDQLQKKLFYDSGRKPYSMKIGDKWVPLQTFGVFAWALGLPAAVKYYNDESRTALTDTNLEKLTEMIVSPLGFWSGQTFVSGLGSFVKLAEGDTDYTLPKNIGFTLSQLRPMAGLVRYVATAIDPIYRNPRTMEDQLFKADIPFLTKSLPAYKTTFGDPAERNVTNYIAPYGQGQSNPQFEDLYQTRTDQLQQNAVLNKMKSDLINRGDSSIVDQANAADDSYSPSIVDTKSTMKEKMLNQAAYTKAKLTGAIQDTPNFVYVPNERGGIDTIQKNRQITTPTLTGQTELDKKLISNYKSDITAKINDVVKLYEINKLSKEDAEKQIEVLKAQSNIGGGRKKVKKLKAPTIKLTKPKKVKLPKIKQVRVKQYKLKKVKLSNKS